MEISHWHWWIASVVLIAVEIVAPGTAWFLWMGIAAALTGAVAWLAPALGWEWQVSLFALCSISTTTVWRTYAKKKLPVSDEPNLNRRGEQYVGRVFTLAEPITNGYGKIRVDDTTWKIEGADLPAGTKIRVSGVDGTILKVTAVHL